MKHVDTYDASIANELELNARVLSEFRVWCFTMNYQYSQTIFDQYLTYVGLDATVERVGHKRWIWRINDIQYLNYKYRVERNCHYSAIVHSIRLRQEILSS
jgi:hypothetical protein